MANEIIIVDSSQDSESIQYDFVEFCSSKKIKLIHHQSDKLIYPGHARNIGIDISNSNLIAPMLQIPDAGFALDQTPGVVGKLPVPQEAQTD